MLHFSYGITSFGKFCAVKKNDKWAIGLGNKVQAHTYLKKREDSANSLFVCLFAKD